MSKNYLDADGLDHYHKGISDILDKNLNGDFVENNEFTFRATDGITSIKTGTAYLERIKGNTVKWNQQLIDKSVSDVNWEWSLANGALNVVITNKFSLNYANIFGTVADNTHKWLVYVKNYNIVGAIYIYDFLTGRSEAVHNVVESIIVTGLKRLQLYAASAKPESNLQANIQLFDLTLIYGEGNEPSTIAQFEADYYKWFGKPLAYESFTEGELRDVKMSAIKTIGFNAFNLSTGKAKLIGGQEYEVVGTYTSLTIDGESVTLVDGKFTPAQSCELVVTGGDSTTCVHLVHSGKRNGESEPHWEETKNVPITTLTGKLNGEGESVIVFPDGMKSAGEVQDEIYIENGKTYAIKRVGNVDLGTLNYERHLFGEIYTFAGNYNGAVTFFNLVISKYANGGEINASALLNKEFRGSNSNSSYIYIRDDDYTDAATFKAAMDGVPLYYELATPLVYELDNLQLPLPYRVDDYGTEEIKGAENSVAPTLDIRYGINIIDTIRNLPKTIDSIETEISDANDSINDAFDAIDAKEDKLAFSHSTSEVPPSTAATFAPQVNHIYYQHERTPVIGNINMVLPVPTTERAAIKVIYRNNTADAPTITSAEGVNVIIESNIGGPYRLTTINCEWYHDCWVVDIQTHGT